MSHSFITKLQEYFPNAHDWMNEPVKSEVLAMLEAEIGYSLPASFKQFYSVHNGEKGTVGIFLGLQCLSIEEMLRHWRDNQQYVEHVSNGVISFEKDTIKEQSYHANWLPIAFDHGGNYIGIDFSPDKLGTLGQIINFGRDEEELFVISRSFDVFLDIVLMQFENGNCTVETDEEGDFYIAWREEGHFFNDLKEVIPLITSIEGTIEEFNLYWNTLTEEWKSAITENVGRQPDSFTDLAKIKSLNLLKSNITDLFPLTGFRHLRKLVASGLNIVDFTPLSQLTELTELFLAKTPFSDLSTLLPLQNLKRLFIGRTNIQDIHLLPHLANLQEISLANLKIADLGPLVDCKKIKILDVSHIRSENLDPIGRLSQLVELDLLYVPLNDLQFLKTLINLKDLRISKSGDSDYKVFCDLTSIEFITAEFEVFLLTKDILQRKISYTISGEMNEEERLIYHNYVMKG